MQIYCLTRLKSDSNHIYMNLDPDPRILIVKKMDLDPRIHIVRKRIRPEKEKFNGSIIFKEEAAVTLIV